MILRLANLVMVYGDSIYLSIKLIYSKFSNERKFSVNRCIAMPTLTSLCLFVVAAFAVCI